MGNLGATEILLIFLVILLLFGAKRIPEIARGLGKGIREFKDATVDIKREIAVDDQMRLNQPQYGGQPRDQRPYDAQVPTAAPAAPAPASHPAYGAPAGEDHPAYGGTPPPQNG